MKLKNSGPKSSQQEKTSFSMPKVDHTKTDYKLYSSGKSGDTTLNKSTNKANNSLLNESGLITDQIKKISPVT